MGWPFFSERRFVVADGGKNGAVDVSIVRIEIFFYR